MKGRWAGLLSLVAACSSRGGSLGFPLEGGANSDVSAALDTGIRSDDTGARPEDAGTPIEDAGAPPTDTGTPPVDVGPASECTMDSECSALGRVCDRLLNRCVECIADADCGRGRFCPPSHVCAVQVCSPGGSSCLGANRQSVCNPRGSAQVEAACASGETCRAGRCQPATCAPGSATCDEATGQRRVCNAEGSGTSLVACPSGQRCRDNVCAALACTPNSRACVGTTSLRTCNSTGTEATTVVCPALPNAIGACAASTCGFACSDGFGNCDNTFSNGCETSLTTSAAHCGMCGRACASGQTCRDGACVTGSSTSTDFRVTSLDGEACTIAGHVALSGDDRGGIAVSSDSLYLNGDVAMVGAPLSDLGRVAALSAPHDGIFSDLATGAVYVLLTTAGTEPSFGTTEVINRIGRLGSAGALMAGPTALSSNITFAVSTSQHPLIFAGYRQLVVYAGSSTAASGNWYAISLPSGTVRSLGAIAMPAHVVCENGSAWGIAEAAGAEVSVLYVESPTAIARYNLATRAVTRTAFTNLADMCSITLSTTTNRWCFHVQQETQFARGRGIMGYCAATWTSSP